MGAYSLGSTPREVKTERVATGSVAEMREAKDMASSKENSVTAPAFPKAYKRWPVMSVATNVPTKAKAKIDPS